MIFLFGMYVVSSLLLIAYIVKLSREEREGLEMKIMAMSDRPEAIQIVRDTSTPLKEVHYIDEEKEFELQMSGRGT